MTIDDPMTLLPVTPLPMSLAGLAGLVLGAWFFGGLWWTLRRSLLSDRAALWLLGSLLLRVGVTLAGFHLAGGGQWQRLLACLAGFVLARMLVLRMTRAVAPSPAPARKLQEAGHASQS